MDDFKPCPLASERSTEDDCEGYEHADHVVTVARDLWTERLFSACSTCKAAFDNWEPSDEDRANGPNVEGSIGYRTEDTAPYRRALKDAGR